MSPGQRRRLRRGPVARREGSADTTRILLALAAVPTAVTRGMELAGLAHPGNVVRACSALPLGAAAGWIFVRSLRAEASVAL